MERTILITRIDAVLPQTQCRQCGYDGCKPYATAIAEGEADINQCPPGGDEGIHVLASLLDVEYKPLNPQHGQYKPKALAVIDESLCIGCTLCIQACPVDAIMGASKQMHTVIASECTGCELCLAPCPVDCISMEPLPVSGQKAEVLLLKQAADLARERHMFRLFRLARDRREKSERRAQRATSGAGTSSASGVAADAAKKAAIAAAMARVKAQQAAATPQNVTALKPELAAEILAIDARRVAAAQITNSADLTKSSQERDQST